MTHASRADGGPTEGRRLGGERNPGQAAGRQNHDRVHSALIRSGMWRNIFRYRGCPWATGARGSLVGHRARSVGTFGGPGADRHGEVALERCSGEATAGSTTGVAVTTS